MSNNQQANQPDSSMISTALVALSLISIFLIAGWYLFSPYISWATVQTTLFVKNLLLPFTFFMSLEKADFILHMDTYLERNIDYTTTTIGEVIFLQTIAFRSISVILIPLLLWRAFSNIIFAKKIGFTRELDLHQLAEIQANRYPRMKPVIKAKLLDQDHRFGPWATSRNPLPYLIHNNLVTDIKDPELALVGLKQFHELSYKEKLDELNNFHGKLVIDKQKVQGLLSNQLGSLCQYNDQQIIDIDQLGTIERTMAILFLAAHTQKKAIRARINKLLDQFGNSFVEGRPATENDPAKPHTLDLSGVEELWEDVKDTPAVKRALLRASKTHAYWSTFFTALFQFIYDQFRNLKSRDFIFLKPVNRTLYLTCNQVGLERSRAETCGIRAHYIAEKKLGSPIIEPCIHSVADSLLWSIQEEGWLHEDIVEDDLDTRINILNKQYSNDLAEYKEWIKTKETEA